MTPSPTEHGNGLADALAGSADRAIHTTQRVANEALDSLGNRVEDLRRQAGPMLDRASDTAGNLGHRGVDAVRETAQSIRARAQHASDSTLDYIRTEPLKAVLIAAATGAVLMALVSLMRNSRH
jgi:ElaB/YqjD/DUF883 family membrane-anchored ribosome-binding protein